jgi:ABC-2 type transport system permease protein
MATILTIARTEWRLLVRSRSYAVLLVVFTTLLAAATLLSVWRQARQRDQQHHYQSLVREQWENQPDRHPHRVAHYGTFAFKPVGPLAAFDPGVESYAGRVQFLEAHRQNAANFAEAGSLSSAFRLGELSPAFLLHILLPLVVIVLGHRLLAGELETDRLRLLLSQPLGPRALLAGKAAGLGLALTPFLLLSAIASVGGVGFTPAGETSPWPRLMLVAGIALLHLGGWLVVTLWISSRAPTSARALGTLLALWVVGGIVLPRGAAALAAAWHPLPSKSEFDARLAAEVHRQGDSHNPNDPTFSRLREDTLAQYGVTRVEDLPVNYGAIVMTRGEELTAETFARHFEELTALRERQEALVHRAALLSPVLAARLLSAAASGTDLRALAAFERDAEAYRYAFVQELNALHRDRIRYENDRAQRLSADHWREFADFHAVVPSLREALEGAARLWVALALWLIVPAVALFRGRLTP